VFLQAGVFNKNRSVKYTVIGLNITLAQLAYRHLMERSVLSDSLNTSDSEAVPESEGLKPISPGHSSVGIKNLTEDTGRAKPREAGEVVSTLSMACAPQNSRAVGD
jgi:hypothetical protein